MLCIQISVLGEARWLQQYVHLIPLINYRQQSTGVLFIKTQKLGNEANIKQNLNAIYSTPTCNKLPVERENGNSSCSSLTDIIIENSPKSNKLFWLSEKHLSSCHWICARIFYSIFHFLRPNDLFSLTIIVVELLREN